MNQKFFQQFARVMVVATFVTNCAFAYLPALNAYSEKSDSRQAGLPASTQSNYDSHIRQAGLPATTQSNYDSHIRQAGLPATTQSNYDSYIRQAGLSASTQSNYDSHIRQAGKPEENIWKDRQKTVQLASLPINLPKIQPASFNPARIHSKISIKPQFNSTITESLPTSFLRHVNLKSIYNGKSPSTIILLEDVHQNLEAQTHLSQAIQSFHEKPLTAPVLVALEGAHGGFKFDEYKKIANPEIRQWVADSFLKTGDISGPAHAGFVASSDGGKSLQFWGIDDPVLYPQNVAAYKNSSLIKARVVAELDRQQKEINTQKQLTFNPELKKFDSILSAYRNNKISLGELALTLAQHPSSRESFSFSLFVEAVQMEKSLRFDRVEAERAQVLERLVKQLNQDETKNLLELSLGYQQGDVTFAGYYSELKKICREHDIDLSKTPFLDNYIRYVVMADGVNAEELFSEISSRTKAVLAKLSKTDSEKELIEEDHQLYLTQKLAGFGLTSHEWEMYQQAKKSQYLIHPSNQQDLSTFEDFYLSADKRSEAMVSNTQKALKEKGASQAVLVSGGFHTSKLVSLLKKENLSFVIATPKITKLEEGKSGSEYLSVFDREKTALDKIFEGKKLFLSAPVPGAKTPIGGTSVKSVLPAMIISALSVLAATTGRVEAATVSNAQLIAPISSVYVNPGQVTQVDFSVPGGKVQVAVKSNEQNAQRNARATNIEYRKVGPFQLETTVKQSMGARVQSAWIRLLTFFGGILAFGAIFMAPTRSSSGQGEEKSSGLQLDVKYALSTAVQNRGADSTTFKTKWSRLQSFIANKLRLKAKPEPELQKQIDINGRSVEIRNFLDSQLVTIAKTAKELAERVSTASGKNSVKNFIFLASDKSFYGAQFLAEAARMQSSRSGVASVPPKFHFITGQDDVLAFDAQGFDWGSTVVFHSGEATNAVALRSLENRIKISGEEAAAAQKIISLYDLGQNRGWRTSHHFFFLFTTLLYGFLTHKKMNSFVNGVLGFDSSPEGIPFQLLGLIDMFRAEQFHQRKSVHVLADEVSRPLFDWLQLRMGVKWQEQLPLRFTSEALTETSREDFYLLVETNGHGNINSEKLRKERQPHASLKLPQLDEKSLGEYFAFFVYFEFLMREYFSKSTTKPAEKLKAKAGAAPVALPGSENRETLFEPAQITSVQFSPKNQAAVALAPTHSRIEFHPAAGETTELLLRRAAQAVVLWAKENSDLPPAMRVLVGFQGNHQKASGWVTETFLGNQFRTDLVAEAVPSFLLAEASLGHEAHGLSVEVQGGDRPWLSLFVNGIPLNEKEMKKIVSIYNNLSLNTLRYVSLAQTHGQPGLTRERNLGAALRDRFAGTFPDLLDFLTTYKTEPDHKFFSIAVDSGDESAEFLKKIFGFLQVGLVRPQRVSTQILYSESSKPTIPINFMESMIHGSVGFLFDQTNGRFFVADIDGKSILGPEKLGVIFAHYLSEVRKEKGAFYFDPEISQSVSEAVLQRLSIEKKATVKDPRGLKQYRNHLTTVLDPQGRLSFSLDGEFFFNNPVAQAFLAIEILTRSGRSLSNYYGRLEKGLDPMEIVDPSTQPKPTFDHPELRLKPTIKDGPIKHVIGAPINAIAYSPDGKRIAVATTKAKSFKSHGVVVTLRDDSRDFVPSKRGIHEATFVSFVINDKTRNGQTLVWGNPYQGQLTRWERIGNSLQQESFKNAVAGRKIIGFSSDGEISIYQMENGEIALARENELSGFIHLESLQGLVRSTFDSRGKYLLTATSNGIAQIWSTETGALLREFEPIKSPITSMTFDPSAAFIAIGTAEGKIHVGAVKVKNAQSNLGQFRSFILEPYAINAVAFVSGYKSLVAGNSKGDVFLLDMQSRNVDFHRLEGNHSTITSIAVSPDCSEIATGDVSGVVLRQLIPSLPRLGTQTFTFLQSPFLLSSLVFLGALKGVGFDSNLVLILGAIILVAGGLVLNMNSTPSDGSKKGSPSQDHDLKGAIHWVVFGQGRKQGNILVGVQSSVTAALSIVTWGKNEKGNKLIRPFELAGRQNIFLSSDKRVLLGFDPLAKTLHRYNLESSNLEKSRQLDQSVQKILAVGASDGDVVQTTDILEETTQGIFLNYGTNRVKLGYLEKVQQAVFSYGGHVLVIIDGKGRGYVIEVENGAIRHEFQVPSYERVTSLTVHSNSKKIAIGTDSGNIYIASTQKDGPEVRQILKYDPEFDQGVPQTGQIEPLITALHFAAQGKKLIYGNSRGEVEVWDSNEEKFQPISTGGHVPITSLDSNDLEEVLIGDEAGHVYERKIPSLSVDLKGSNGEAIGGTYTYDDEGGASVRLNSPWFAGVAAILLASGNMNSDVFLTIASLSHETISGFFVLVGMFVSSWILARRHRYPNPKMSVSPTVTNRSPKREKLPLSAAALSLQQAGLGKWVLARVLNRLAPKGSVTTIENFSPIAASLNYGLNLAKAQPNTEEAIEEAVLLATLYLNELNQMEVKGQSIPQEARDILKDKTLAPSLNQPMVSVVNIGQSPDPKTISDDLSALSIILSQATEWTTKGFAHDVVLVDHGNMDEGQYMRLENIYSSVLGNFKREHLRIVDLKSKKVSIYKGDSFPFERVPHSYDDLLRVVGKNSGDKMRTVNQLVDRLNTGQSMAGLSFRTVDRVPGMFLTSESLKSIWTALLNFGLGWVTISIQDRIKAQQAVDVAA